MPIFTAMQSMVINSCRNAKHCDQDCPHSAKLTCNLSCTELSCICFSLSLASYCSRCFLSAAAASFLWLASRALATWRASTSTCTWERQRQLVHRRLCQNVQKLCPTYSWWLNIRCQTFDLLNVSAATDVTKVLPSVTEQQMPPACPGD